MKSRETLGTRNEPSGAWTWNDGVESSADFECVMLERSDGR